jgi:hypothetical protein|tara:strand:- start:116 stop:499 length:384 start_codon:yes stop_codon:yes gene_type:complete
MPTKDYIDLNNTVSKNRQRESRAARNRSKDIQKERSSRLRAAESTGERREIKDQYQKMEGGVWDVSTSQTEVSNNEGYNTDISSSAGVDSALDPVRGGLPSDLAEETLDVVNNDNTAGQRVFLTKAV